MAPSRSRTSWLSAFAILFALLSFFAPVQAVYFYMDSTQPKCFYEELPKDTLVVGNYAAEVYSTASNSYVTDQSLNILITVDETFDNDHRVVRQTGHASGRFTFSAADPGEHKVCFTPSNAPSTGGWLSGGAPLGGVKMSLDLAIGETSKIESEDKGKIADIVQKVRDLNARLTDVRREQQFQREREAEFRDQSEATNSRVVRWTLIQLGVLGVTCAWQLSHLRSFFIKQKLT